MNNSKSLVPTVHVLEGRAVSSYNGTRQTPNQNFRIMNNTKAYSGNSSFPIAFNPATPQDQVRFAGARQQLFAKIAPSQAMPAPPPSNILSPQKYAPLNTAQEMAAANVFPLAPSITVQIAASSAGGSAAVRCYVFNQTDLNNVTNNGAGAGSVTYTYQDGFSGAVTNKLIGLARNGMGAICYGVAVRMIVTSSKAGDPTGLASANPRFDVYNLLGSSVPTNFNITTDQTRKDFDNSIEVMTCIQNITQFSQFSLIVQPGDTATMTFYFTPDFNS